jgi:predicted RNA-binding protein (virulence factor B family)
MLLPLPLLHATSATNAATSAASAANSVTAINNLGYYLNWGLITDAVGTTSDYGALV